MLAECEKYSSKIIWEMLKNLKSFQLSMGPKLLPKRLFWCLSVIEVEFYRKFSLKTIMEKTFTHKNVFLQLSSPLASENHEKEWDENNLRCFRWQFIETPKKGRRREERKNKTKGWIERRKAHNILFIQWRTRSEEKEKHFLSIATSA